MNSQPNQRRLEYGIKRKMTKAPTYGEAGAYDTIVKRMPRHYECGRL